MRRRAAAACQHALRMIGLKVEDRPVMRAYSIASSNHDEYLQFFSIKVQKGLLTSRLCNT